MSTQDTPNPPAGFHNYDREGQNHPPFPTPEAPDKIPSGSTESEEERWVEGYGKDYSVSNKGNVYSYKCGKKVLLKQGAGKNPKRSQYYVVSLCKDNISKTARVHRLVIEHFTPNPGNKPNINHIDGNKLNNHVSNLEWCTQKENVIHARDVLGHKRRCLTLGVSNKGKIHSMPVVKCNLNGDVIEEYKSIRQATIINKLDGVKLAKVIYSDTKVWGEFIWKLK